MMAQSHGNEWIDYSRIHVKVKVFQDGIHRVSYSTLQQAGLPVQTISPAAFRVYAREKEEPIWVSGAGDGSFDFGDYIEFVGKKNNGWLDSLMYADPSGMGNPHYSLVNDTIHYFITWDENTPGLRFDLEEDQDFAAYPSPNYVTCKTRSVLSEDYSSGILLSFDNRNTEFVRSEGWMGTRFGKGAGALNRELFLQTPDAYNGSDAPPTSGKTRFASATNSSAGILPGNHHIQVFRGQNNEVQLADLIFSGYDLRNVDLIVPAAQLTSTLRLNYVVIDDLNIATDMFRIGFAELNYARSKNYTTGTPYEIRVNANLAGSKYHLDLTGINYSAPIVYVKGTHPYRLSPVVNGNALDVVIPDQPLDASSKVFMADESSVIQVAQVQRVGVNGIFTDYASMQPDSAFIIVTHKSLWNSALTYATYRTDPNRDAVLVNVAELYDQYGGGIPKHAHGIRRFCADIIDSWDSDPAHLFLLGKSVYGDIEGNLVGSRRSVTHYSKNLVPSYGNPGSDILFTSGLNGNQTIVPAIATGRLSALTSQEVIDYLAKIVQNESANPAAWMKNILHFGGGANLGEQTLFAQYLSNYEAIIEDTCFGGNVHTFLKESSLPIVFNISDSIADVIEDGVSLLTFFGHAGGGQFDQSIDDPENLEWGAHPFVIVNSCYSGDIHQLTHASTSEKYVILPNKGAIAFLATIKQGLPGYLDVYSTELYKQVGYKSYGKSVGEQVRKTIQTLAVDWSEVPESRNSVLMNLLEGDPSTIIFSPEKTDITLSQSSISFSPSEITAFVDSFQVHVQLTNIGKTTSDPFNLILERTYPNGNTTTFSKTVNGLLFQELVTFTIPTDFANAFGLNTIEVSADLPSNVIPEIDNFFNNRATRTLLITDGAVSPILPYPFAIVPPEQTILKASTGNPFASVKDYAMQVDTTDLFNSPFLQEHFITQGGGVMSWQPSLLTADSTVYFWRVAEESVIPEEREWRESSFQVITDRIGWGQSHYYQFKENRFNNLVYDRPEREIDFFSGLKNVKCDVTGNSVDAEYFIDFESQEYNGCGGIAAFHVAVIDPVNLIPWGSRWNGLNPDHYFGNVNDNGSCRNRVERYFIFRQNDLDQMSGFQNMIENEIPDGYIFLIYTWQRAEPTLWPTFLPDYSDLFNGIGADDIAALDSQVPFIFIGVKGEPSLSVQVIGDTVTSSITSEYFAPVFGNTGTMTSGLIGPASQWNSLYWEFAEANANDSVRVKVIPLNLDLQEETGSTLDLFVSATQPLDLGGILDAETYPFIKLQTYLHDPVDLDPAQLRRWQVLYEPVPEAALNPVLKFVFESDSVQEGQMLHLQTAIQNISSLDMDSLLVRYWIEKSDNSVQEVNYPRQDSLRAGESFIDTLFLSTLGLKGINDLWVEVNPKIAGTNIYDQAEQTHVNNLGRIRFSVSQDKLNPILDVTFDGEHILDGDLVSALPIITVRLDDENPFLLMDDPADTVFFNLFLTEPNGFRKQLRFQSGDGEELMRFIPADGAKNISQIEIKPDLIQDGTYRLLVIASDKSGNASGNVDYKISFTVDHVSSITEVMNYPNPFSTQTRFVFTLTGVTVPSYMKIQIMTVTGKVVREIFKEELGTIRIGRNITDYAWDGRDEYGDPLGNGVYLYRVIVKDEQGDIEVRQTAASSFFKKGFGKMYLMR
jgi:hypothetical protein